MYFERGGLIVWALVLFTTTCFVLTPGVSTTSDPPDPDHKNETSKSPQSSMSQVTLPETRDNGGQGNNGDETAKTVAASEGPTKHVLEGEEDSNEPLVTKGKTVGVLYYEITKRISERNLTLGDIQEVLSRKDDESLFMYTLADKLGYIVKEKYDDPHIPVIMSKKNKLIALLEKKARLSTPSSQEEADQDSAVSETPPISSEPAAHIDKQKIAFEVTKAIDKLEAEAIDALISDPTLSGIFGYAVGSELGYSDDDEHMKYLENMDEEKLRNHMQQILDSKMRSKKKTSTIDGEGPEDQAQETSGGIVPNRNGQTQGEEKNNNADAPSKESNDKKQSTDTGVLKTTEESLEEGTWKELQWVDKDPKNPSLEPSFQVTKPSEGAAKASAEEPNKEGSLTENEGLSQQTSGVVSPSKNGGPSPATKKSGRIESTERIKKPKVISPDKGIKGGNENSHGKGSPNYGEDKDFNGLWELEQQLTHEDEFMKYLQKTNKELYDHLLSGDAGRTVIKEAMELYEKWEPEMIQGNSDIPGNEEGNKGKKEQTKPGGGTSREDSRRNNLEDMNTYHHTDDSWMPAYHQYRSGVNLRDYIMFCLLIGIAVGIGYLCSCAKRKVAPVRIVMIKRPDMKSNYNVARVH